jgi:hypothetical protein
LRYGTRALTVRLGVSRGSLSDCRKKPGNRVGCRHTPKGILMRRGSPEFSRFAKIVVNLYRDTLV